MDDQDDTLAQDVRRVIDMAARDAEGRAALLRLSELIGRAVEAATQAAVEPDPDEAIVPMDRTAFEELVRKAAVPSGIDAPEGGPLAAALRQAASLPPSPPTGTPTLPTDQQTGRDAPEDAGEDARTERDAQLPGLAERTRAKAMVTRALAAERAGGPALDETLVHRARSTGATVWMLDAADPEPGHLAALADCYEAVADAADLLVALGRGGLLDTRFVAAVRDLAAVQSALRVTAHRFRWTADEDQLAAFEWVRLTTAAERIFVERHLRLDDPLDIDDLPSVASRIRSELDLIQAAEDRREARQKGLGQVRYHAGRIARGHGTDHDQEKVVEAVEELVEAGLPASNLELRALLDEIRDELPEARPDSGYGRVLADLDAHRQRSAQPRAASPRKRAPSEQVIRAAELLRGTELVVIGGERRVAVEATIRESFGLSDLTWFAISEDPTLAEVERAIARPEVSVVVQLIRWSRHRFGDARDIADRHGKPFVRVPAGSNANAIARAILDQASERLGRQADEDDHGTHTGG